MKKVCFFLTVIIALMMCLVSCGDSSAPEPSSQSSYSQTEISVPDYSDDSSGEDIGDISTGSEETPPARKDFDENDIVLTFTALSDIHQNGDTDSDAGKKFISALNTLKDGYDLDAFLIAGDLTDSGSSSQINQFVSSFKSVYSDPLPVIYCMGNHDGQGGSSAALFSEAFGGGYFTADIDAAATARGNRHAVVNGYHFITIETLSYYNTSGDCSFSSETLSWFRDALASAAADDPTKPIFIATHSMPYNTCYGSTLPSTGTNWYTTMLTSILSEYPQAVTFGGHLHHPLNDERSIMQTSFTSLGCGSVSYMAIEGGYVQTGTGTVPSDARLYSQGLVVEVDANNNVRFTRMDFYNKSTVKSPWIIDAPTSDGSHLEKYTANRATDTNDAPYFEVHSPDTEIKRSTTLYPKDYKISITLTFPSAIDDDLVHHYIAETYIDGQIYNTVKLLSDFYLVPDISMMKKTQTVTMPKLPTATDIEFRIYAVDSWGIRSEPLVYKMTTWGDPRPTDPDASNDKELPEAYADIVFKSDGTCADSKNKLTVSVSGAVIADTEFKRGGSVVTLPALNINALSQGLTAEFNEMKNVSDANDFFDRGFTAEAVFVNRSLTGTHGIICGTQAGGWGIAQRANGTLYFIVSNGSYISVDAASAVPTDSLTHVVAVCDTSKGELRIYINGVLSSRTAFTGAYKSGTGSSFNRFCLGGDINDAGNIGDFLTSDFSITTARIYDSALTDANAAELYRMSVE